MKDDLLLVNFYLGVYKKIFSPYFLIDRTPELAKRRGNGKNSLYKKNISTVNVFWTWKQS